MLNSNLQNKYGYVRKLTAADDMNNIVENGLYYYTTGDAPENAPYSSAAIVEVFGSNSNTTQKIQRATRYATPGYECFRSLSGNGWFEWVTLLTDTNLHSDTSATVIELVNVESATPNRNVYIRKNGMCLLHLFIRPSSDVESLTYLVNAGGVPKPVNMGTNLIFALAPDTSSFEPVVGEAVLDTAGSIRIRRAKANVSYGATICYPCG